MRIGPSVRRTLLSLGLDVRLTRNNAIIEEAERIGKWRLSWNALRHLAPIRTVIDVGANEGQFSRMIHDVFPEASVFAFEPLPICRAPLEATLQAIPGSRLFPVALGSSPGVARFRQASSTVCSSMLVPSDRLRSEVDGLRITAELDVPVSTLDAVLEPLRPEAPLLLKLDVQGFEREVLRGALATLERATLVVLEVAFVPLYDGQPLFDELYAFMKNHGYQYRGNLDQNLSKKDGLVHEADALFVRRDAPQR